MDFLLDNPLATMDGPAFLVFFGGFIILAVIAVAFPRVNSDNTNKLPIPPIPPNPDPYEIAFLRGGNNEVARSVIFSLVQNGLVEIVTGEKQSILRLKVSKEHPAGVGQIEQQAMQWLVTEREAKDVFTRGAGLVEQLLPYGVVYRDALEKRQLLTSDQASKRLRKIGRIAAGAIAALGGYKVIASIAYGYYNVAFTIIGSVIAGIVITSIARLPRLTKLGKIYLDRLQLAFDNLKRTSQAPYVRTAEPHARPQASFSAVDPLLLSVGVFGTGILAGTVFDGYNTAFQKAQKDAGSGTGGCGSSCGSGCSSGSDGGGSSCGGGCGGGGCGGGCGG